MSRATATVALAAALAAVAVVAVVGGDSSDDSGTGSSVSTSAGSDGGGVTTEEARPDLTSAQRNALETAKRHLELEAYSKKALIRQLSSKAGDGYSRADATYAVNHAGADWELEAVEGARGRLDSSDLGYSKQSLIWHLSVADGHSKADATYAANHAGADWNTEAVEAGKARLDQEAFSRSELMQKLTSGDGFTQAQARYAVEKVY